MTADRQAVRAQGPLSSRRPLWLGAAAAVAAFGCLAVVLWYGEALTPAVPTLQQAGPVTDIGLPVAKLAMNAAGIITVGWLLMAVAFLPVPPGGELTAAGWRSLRAASIGAVAWALAALALATFSASSLLGRPIADVLAQGALVEFLVDLPEGRALLGITVAAAILSVGAHLPKRPAGAGYLLVLALAALAPPVFTGHAAAASYHALTVFSLAFHVVGAATWIGGLVVLVVMAGRLRDQLATVVSRFSGLALVCFLTVGVSGLVNAWFRLGGLNLGSPYGKLVVAKAVAITGLGIMGWWHRRASIPALRENGGRRTFLRIAAAEVVVMAATVALATGLSRTPPPELPAADVLTRHLLGFDFPAAPSLSAYALDWWIDWLFIIPVIAGIVLYAIGLARLRRAGIPWPVARTVAWYAGVAIAFLATSGGMAKYSLVIFSAHIAQRIILGTLVPVLLILGGPGTLALRALRTGGSSGRSPRDLVAGLMGSGGIRLLTYPLVALPVFVGCLYGLYLTPLFDVSLADQALHSLGLALLLAAGVLFLWPLIGDEHAPHGLDSTVRIALLTVVIPVHTFFGITLMWSQSLLAEDWYSFLTRSWGPGALDDQQFGGQLGWLMGSATTLLAMLVLGVRWFRGPRRAGVETGRAGPLEPPEPPEPRGPTGPGEPASAGRWGGSG